MNHHPNSTEKPHHPVHSEQLLLNEVQVLLAEKRTYYSLLRAGIAIFTVPLTVLGFLLATASYHGLFARAWLAFLIVVLFLAVATLGLGILATSERKIQRVNKFIRHIRAENAHIAKIVID